MTREQFLLIKLSEECVEVAQRALKQVQFGKDEIQKDQPFTNAQRLKSELMDLSVLVSLLSEAGEIPEAKLEEFSVAQLNKIKKLQKYADYSHSLGVLPEITI